MNNIIVVSGPSGSGKSTLINMLLKEHHDIIFSISHTTRAPRELEQDRIEYYFISKEQFLQMIEEGAFVEWAQVHDKFYGTSLEEVENKSSGTKFLVLDIDVQGAKIIRDKFPNATFILVAPPSVKELKKRLISRENEITEEYHQRIQIARDELAEYEVYDYIIINDELRKAYGVMNSIYTACKNSTARNEKYIQRIIGSA
jgi:guanylate kinase